MKKALALVCLAAAVAALAACNDNNSSPTAASSPTPAPNPSPSPGGCTQTTLATATRPLTRDVLDSTAFTTTQAGPVTVTVDWTNQQANVGAFIVQAGTCTAQRFNRSNCSFLAESGNDKPHKIQVSLPAGSYELLLDDFGAGGGVKGASSETATVRIVQSTGC